MLEHYLNGFETGARAHKPLRMPTAASVSDHAPDWIEEASPRAFAWLKGFYTAWNFLAEMKGWPEWTYARMVFKRIKEGDGYGSA